MKLNDKTETDPRLFAIPDIHGHAKGEHKPYAEERPIPLSARMLFLWFFHACRRGWPRFLMVSDHMNYLTFEDPAAVNLVRRALKLAQAGDLYGAAETASVEVGHAAVVSEGLRRGMRYSIGAEVDNDPRSRPDAQNIVDAMKPDGMIRSVHFIAVTHPVHGENWNWPFDNPEFADVFEIVGTEKTWEIYVDTLIDAVERLPGQIVGHFYVPGVFGHWPDDATLERYEDRLLEACEARGMAIEFNTRFLYRETDPENRARFIAAYTRLLTKAKAKNVGIAVGSDAHSPRDQGGGFATVLEILDACEINEIVFPIAGRLARVALRAERAPEPEPPDVPESAPAEKKPARKARRGETPEPAAEADVASPVAAPEPAPEPVSAAPRAPKKKAPKAASAPPPPAVEDGPGAVAVEPAAEPVAAEPEPEPVPEPTPEPVMAAAPEPEAVAAPEPEPAPEPVPAAPATPVRAAKPAKAPVKASPAKAPPAKAKAKAPAPAPKRAPAKKAAPAAKPPAKKVAAKASKAAAAKRPVAKKSAPAKKAAAKKAPAKKAVAKRAPARPAPKKAAVRRPAVKKAAPKKAAAKKPAAKKSAKRR